MVFNLQFELFRRLVSPLIKLILYLAYPATTCSSVSTRLVNLRACFIYWAVLLGSCGRRTAHGQFTKIFDKCTGGTQQVSEIGRLLEDIIWFKLIFVLLLYLLVFHTACVTFTTLNNVIENQVGSAFKYQTMYFRSTVNFQNVDLSLGLLSGFCIYQPSVLLAIWLFCIIL